MIARDDVDRLRRNGVGRPRSALSAWAVLALADGGEPELSLVERFRARQRLVDRGRVGLAAQVRARADQRDAYAHPSILDRVVDDVRVVRGGVSALRESDVDLIVGDAAEIYVRASQIAEIADEYSLDGDADRPNLIVRVVDDEVCAAFAAGLEDLSFELDGIGPDGIAHRYRRNRVTADILAPEGIGELTDLTTTSPGRTVQVQGGTQALDRTELLPVAASTRDVLIVGDLGRFTPLAP